MSNPFEIIDARLKNIEDLLLDLKHSEKKGSLSQTESLLTVEQAAEMLFLSVSTIYGLVQRKEIPVSKRSKRLYFSREELTQWIKEGRKKTVTEVRMEADRFAKEPSRRKKSHSE